MNVSARGIWLWSDVHLEFPEQLDSYAALPAPPDGDPVILAGDIAVGTAGVRWATATFPNNPVAYVLGNHEAYGADLDITYHACRAAAAGTNVRILEREVWEIAPGLRLLGTTLWTDYALWGEGYMGDPHRAALRLADHRLITTEGRTFAPMDAWHRHEDSRRWLEAELTRAHRDGVDTVVVTHHAPHVACLSPTHIQRGDPISAAFASDLSELLMGPLAPGTWCSGHTHHNHRGQLGRSKLLSNQAGYVRLGEGTGFLRAGQLVMRLEG